MVDNGTEVICFEVNDWEPYPAIFDEWFDFSGKSGHDDWIGDLDRWAGENRLCIKVVVVDMSVSLVVTAQKKWVDENIPEFREEIWQGWCFYTYPAPYWNDCTDFLLHRDGKPVVAECEEHVLRRRHDLEQMHRIYTEKQIASFVPHDLTGSPSGESFLDWCEENFGASEWEDGKRLGEETGNDKED